MSEVDEKKNTKLNVPDAKTIYEMRHAKEMEEQRQILSRQKEIIEKAFADFRGERDEILLDFDEKMRDELVEQLNEKGYKVFQRSEYDSNDPSKNGRWKVKITTETPSDVYVRSVYRLPFYITPFSSLSWF